jgi:hypothetical protein
VNGVLIHVRSVDIPSAWLASRTLPRRGIASDVAPGP